jgi:hypothetical protein
MTREELAALRDAIDITLALPDNLREMLAQWLTPEAAKPDGHDHHPAVPTPRQRTVKVRAARCAKPTSAKTAERKLVAAMQDNPGLSVIALANALAPADRRLASDCDRWRREALLRRM